MEANAFHARRVRFKYHVHVLACHSDLLSTPTPWQKVRASKFGRIKMAELKQLRADHSAPGLGIRGDCNLALLGNAMSVPGDRLQIRRAPHCGSGARGAPLQGRL